MQFARSLSRAFLAAPIVWSAAILSLALGIGATTAVFSILNGLSLKNLPVAAPERLVTLISRSDALQNQPGAYSYATFDEVRRRTLFAGALAWSRASLTLDDAVQPVSSLWVSGDFFQTLGVPAALGRTLAPGDDLPGGGTDGLVAMISDRLWQRRFSRAPGAIGSVLFIERTPVTIVGVTPPDFRGVEVGWAYDVYLPASTQPQITPNTPSDRHMAIFSVMLRLRDGQSISAATISLRTVQAEIRTASMPPGAVGYLEDAFVLLPSAGGPPTLRERYEAPLVALFAVAVLVLIVSCANVANLMLVRGMTRRKELSVRVALGASRSTLLRDVLAECFALAAVGVALGLTFASWASSALVSRFSSAARGAVLDVSLDWRVLLFAAVAGVGTVLLFGVAPAVRNTRVAPIEALSAEGRGAVGRARGRAINLVLVAQTAVALLLILTAGLFLRTFQELTRVPLGFEPEGLLSVTIAAPHVPPADRNRLYHRLVQATAAVPGVAQVGGGLSEPLRRVGVPIALTVSGARPLPRADTLSFGDDVTPGWRRAAALELLFGRDIDDRDAAGAPPVAMVNEAFVRRFFPGENLLGRTLSVIAHVPPDGEIHLGERTVVGIVADAAHDSIRVAKRPILYRPLAQREGPLFIPFHLVARSATPSTGQLSERVAASLRDVDPELRMTFRPMEETIDEVLAQDRVLAHVSAVGGVFALLLASVGLYGVTAYSVACRRAEFGLRLAMGAVPGTIVTLVLFQVVRLLAAGIAIGAVGSLWVAELVSSLLYGVSPRDPLILVGGVAMLTVMAVAAAWLPAHRASQTDPAGVLRNT
jgi:putative ABC transport system permease protein